MRAGGGCFTSDGGFRAVAAVPCRNAMTPPELARDAPVANVFHPLEEDGLAILGNEADFAAAYGGHGFLGKRLHVHEPLRRDERLDDALAAVTFTQADGVRLAFDQLAGFFQRGEHASTSLEAIELGVRTGGGGHAGIFSDDFHEWQIVPLADLKIVRIVRGRNLYCASAELRIDDRIGNDRNLAAKQRKRNVFAK